MKGQHLSSGNGIVHTPLNLISNSLRIGKKMWESEIEVESCHGKRRQSGAQQPDEEENASSSRHVCEALFGAA